MAYLLTHSLLSAWLRSMKENPYEEGDDPEKETSLQEFMHTLRREKTPTTPAMQAGIDFEDLVTAILTGQEKANYHSTSREGGQTLKVFGTAEHPWYEAAAKVAGMIRGAKLQYVAQKTESVDGMEFLLYGRLDALQAGEIFDIKYSGSYERGKFFSSTQHPMYFRLVPEAYDFVYVISNGYDVWTETYRPGDTVPVEPIIHDFLEWLKLNGLLEIYQEYWAARS